MSRVVLGCERLLADADLIREQTRRPDYQSLRR